MRFNRFFVIAAAFTLLLGATAFGQQRRPMPRQAANSPSRAPSVASSELESNHSIRLHGMLGTGESIDMTLLGVGPVFSADQLVGEDATVVNCRYTVVDHESGGFQVAYRIACRIRMEVSKNKDSINYEYRDVALEGTAICHLGKPVTLLKNGEKSLNLTVSDGAGKASE